MTQKDDRDKEQGSNFRVVDRRRFTEEGESRQQECEEQKSQPSPPASPSTKQQDTKQPASAQPLTFELFLQSLGQQAMMTMGLLPWPDSGLVKTDLKRAREMIDLIALLHEKTAGNLTPDEEKLCKALLHQLRITFVQIVQRGNQPPTNGATKPPQAG